MARFLGIGGDVGCRRRGCWGGLGRWRGNGTWGGLGALRRSVGGLGGDVEVLRGDLGGSPDWGAAGWQVLLFLFFACAGLYFTLQVPVGLDQELAMPKVGGWLWGYPRPRLQGVTGARGWGHAGTAWSSTRMHGVVWLL